MDEQTEFKRFDQVQIITTRNVTYLSAPPGSKISPKGIWQVCGVVDSQLLLAKHNAIIKIPVSDVLKIMNYDVNEFTKNFGRLLDGEGKNGEEG